MGATCMLINQLAKKINIMAIFKFLPELENCTQPTFGHRGTPMLPTHLQEIMKFHLFLTYLFSW